jgi:predicted tellurium resistance membrane protein TerC
MSRFPAIVTFGAALLGYLAGAMIVSDTVAVSWIATRLDSLDLAIPGIGIELSMPGLLGALAVIAIGTWLTKQQQRRET